jgi:DNA-binding GntR family transcriptional regulator
LPNEAPHKLKRIRARNNLKETVYQRLKEAIVKGLFPQGYMLNESELTKAMNISRTPLREAFNRLRAEGLIQAIPNRGVRVVEFSKEDMLELTRVREVLEITFLPQSMENITNQDIKAIRKALVEAESEIKDALTEDDLNQAHQRYLEADNLLHDRLVEACGNKYWIGLYNNIKNRVRMCGQQTVKIPSRFLKAIEQHHAILDALEKKDAELACQVMVTHISNVQKSVIQAAYENTGKESR